MTSQEFAQRVRERRELFGMPVSEVARRAGVSISTVYNVESGDWNPTIETMRKIEKVLWDDIEEKLGITPNGG